MTDKFTMPTEEDIRSAAMCCPEAFSVLEKLFPGAFKEDEPVSPHKVGDIVKSEAYGMGMIKLFEDRGIIGVEWFEPKGELHNLSGHAFNLHGWWVNSDDIIHVYRPKELLTK